MNIFGTRNVFGTKQNYEKFSETAVPVTDITPKQREWIAALEKRKRWLEKRISETTTRRLTYDEQELAALTWVLFNINDIISHNNRHARRIDRSTNDNTRNTKLV